MSMQNYLDAYQELLPADVPYVMIVESDPHIAEALQTLLKQELRRGVLFAATAEAALQITNVLRPQLFLINEQLSDGNGGHLSDMLHQRTHFEEIPIIILSADKEMSQSYQHPLHVFFAALPLELDRLTSAILNILSLYLQREA